MTSLPPGPHERSYWVIPDEFCAGAYPGHPRRREAEDRMRTLLGSGLRTFINLMEEDESDHNGQQFAPYAPVIASLAAEFGGNCECLRYSVRDLSIPSLELMHDIQASLDESIAKGRPVYVHCWGGRGRTGTVVGIYLIRIGLANVDDYVNVIRRLRGADSGGGESPETAEQRNFVQMYCKTIRK